MKTKRPGACRNEPPRAMPLPGFCGTRDAIGGPTASSTKKLGSFILSTSVRLAMTPLAQMVQIPPAKPHNIASFPQPHIPQNATLDHGLCIPFIYATGSLSQSYPYLIHLATLFTEDMWEPKQLLKFQKASISVDHRKVLSVCSLSFLKHGFSSFQVFMLVRRTHV